VHSIPARNGTAGHVPYASPMDLFTTTGRRIETVADWRDPGGPVSGREWAEGRSTRELATAWVEGTAADELTALLSTVPAMDGLLLHDAVAERENDLLVTARSPGGTVVVGVQGKADEPVGEALDTWLTRTRAHEELDRLTTAFFATTLDVDPLLATLRHELVAALAGTLAAAREQEAARAVLLVHEFETPWTDDALHRRNAEDLERFLGRLMPGVEPAGHPRAWIAGPALVPWAGGETETYVAKLVTSTRAA
jgi:hypothetical protein